MNPRDTRLPPTAIRANRYDLLSRCVDDLAHEIRNPLNSMVVNLELVRRKAASQPDVAVERAGLVEEAARHVHELVEALLDALRPPVSVSNHCDVARVLDSVLPLIRARARKAGVELHTDADPGRAAIPTHALALVLLNILDNGVDAAGEGGGVRLAVTSASNGVVVLVEDSGPGLDVAAGDPFLPGFTTRAARPGLGLAVVRQLVEDAGGSVAFDDASSSLGGAALRVVLRRTGDA